MPLRNALPGGTRHAAAILAGPKRTTPALGLHFYYLFQYKGTKTDAQGALLVEIPPANEGGSKRGKGAGAVGAAGAAGGGGGSRSGEGGGGGGKTRERRVRAEVLPSLLALLVQTYTY